MAIIAFKDVSVTINSVDLSNLVSGATLTYEIEQQEATVMGGNRAFVGGIQNNTLEVTLYQDFAATKTEASIFPLVGTTTTVVLKPTSGAVSTTNPSYTLTGTYLTNHTPIAAGDVGSTSPITLTFTGGTLTKATA
jgi:hypothetical protein